MRALGLIVAAALATAACLGPDGHRCATGADCPGGTCEAAGFCSFPGATCQEWGAGAGSLAGTCVVDAGVDGVGAEDAAPVDGRMIDAPSIDADPDPDGDGVPTGVDNCPVDANADQHDEDGDGVGDVCDVCPHVADMMQANMDGDGLGDACDPSPTIARNQILLFEPWSGTGMSGWTAHLGAWQVIDDSLEVTQSNSGSRLSRALPVPPPPGATVIAGFTAEVRGFAVPSYLGVLGPVDFEGGSGDGCVLRYDGQTTLQRVEVTSPTSSSFTQLAPSTTAPFPTFGIEHRRRGIESTCIATLPTSSSTGGFVGQGATVARVGFIARNTHSFVRYVIVYTD